MQADPRAPRLGAALSPLVSRAGSDCRQRPTASRRSAADGAVARRRMRPADPRLGHGRRLRRPGERTVLTDRPHCNNAMKEVRP